MPGYPYSRNPPDPVAIGIVGLRNSQIVEAQDPDALPALLWGLEIDCHQAQFVTLIPDEYEPFWLQGSTWMVNHWYWDKINTQLHQVDVAYSMVQEHYYTISLSRPQPVTFFSGVDDFRPRAQSNPELTVTVELDRRVFGLVAELAGYN